MSSKQQLDSKQTLSTEANVKQPKLSLHVLVSFLITSYDDGTKLTVNLLAIVVVSHAVCQLETRNGKKIYISNTQMYTSAPRTFTYTNFLIVVGKPNVENII